MKKTFLYFATVLLYSSTTLYAQINENKKKQKVQTLSEKFLAENKIPGMAISISINNKLFFSEGFGYSNLKTNEKVKPNLTKFRIASISKTLTAVALAKLVDDKKLDFDASLYTYLPNYPKKKYDFTIRQIGGHIAGIRHYKSNEFLSNKKMTIVNGLDLFKNDPLLFKPGTNYKYSTYGWNLLSVVIQNATNKDYFSYMEDAIFFPLKMNNTIVGNPDINIQNKTTFYIKRNNKIKVAPAVNNVFKAAGGGYLSTSEDLIKFGNELINPTIILKRTFLELVKTQKTSNQKNTKYGIGIVVSKTKNNHLKYSHSGGGIGASTQLLVYPKQNIVICFLTNLSGVKMKNYINELEQILIE
jgi:CubicO group peptidase (beta-lactamase class C family)